mmetsp:Transcript_75273/g.232790  ORF Transcript_75273/g.232790 Transcript_75273/m.232790 type:complete len:253 (-) Transcript_75273:872-1630(-)
MGRRARRSCRRRRRRSGGGAPRAGRTPLRLGGARLRGLREPGVLAARPAAGQVPGPRGRAGTSGDAPRRVLRAQPRDGDSGAWRARRGGRRSHSGKRAAEGSEVRPPRPRPLALRSEARLPRHGQRRLQPPAARPQALPPPLPHARPPAGAAGAGRGHLAPLRAGLLLGGLPAGAPLLRALRRGAGGARLRDACGAARGGLRALRRRGALPRSALRGGGEGAAHGRAPGARAAAAAGGRVGGGLRDAPQAGA